MEAGTKEKFLSIITEVALMFAYDRTLVLDFEESSSVTKDGYTVRDVSYVSPYGGKVPAYLVVPNTDGSLPAIVYVHPGDGNRSAIQF